MAPHAPESTPLPPEKLVAPQAGPRKYQIVYSNILLYTYWHISALYGLYLCCTTAKWQTIALAAVLYVAGDLGITAGAHRLWSHRSYKAKTPLQVILVIFNSIVTDSQITKHNSVIHWARNHRTHHKYSDTDADPHNATRGFFYSHVGWLFVKKHPLAREKALQVDLSDLYANPFLRFQDKYATPVLLTSCFALPTLVPVCFWGEALSAAWNVNLLRFCLSMNSALLVNSAAHMFGNRPYDRSIAPTQSLVASLAVLGEGFHNYHHVFAWDYRAAELGNNYLNVTTKFIDLCARVGWAYELKSVSEDIVKRRMARTGDGTDLWGWGDRDMDREDVDAACVRYPGKEACD